MTDRGVFDPGLQPERTALSWRRAALTLGGVSLLLGRVLAETVGPLGLIVGGSGVVVAILTLVAGERRYRSHHSRLLASAGERIPLAGGALPFLLALTTVVLGLAAAAAVILVAVQ